MILRIQLFVMTTEKAPELLSSDIIQADTFFIFIFLTGIEKWP